MLEQRLRAADDRRQRIVDFVPGACRKLGERRQLGILESARRSGLTRPDREGNGTRVGNRAAGLPKGRRPPQWALLPPRGASLPAPDACLTPSPIPMGEGRGEGSFRALTQLLGNAANPQHRYDDGVQVLDHIVVAKAEDSIAGVLDVLLTLAIVIRAARYGCRRRARSPTDGPNRRSRQCTARSRAAAAP